MVHRCPKCNASGNSINVCEYGREAFNIMYLRCNECGNTSSETISEDQLNNMWPLYTVNDSNTLQNLFFKIADRLEKAEKKHPVFAEGQYEALGFLGEEYGEVTKEITKGKDGWESRMDDELLDLIAVSIRMLRREYTTDA